jgi:hypothetical protein
MNPTVVVPGGALQHARKLSAFRLRDYPHGVQRARRREAAGAREQMSGFLAELFAFLGSSRKVWLRPVVIFLFIIVGLLMFANGWFEAFLPHRADDTVVPFSRGDYRHDGALFNRYSAISRWPSRFR